MTISQAASVNLWREAILDRLAVLCMDAPQDEPPASILRRIIAAEVEIALDPSVSDAVPHRTLLQQALDALEPCVSEEGPEQHELDAARDSLADLREALAAPEPKPVAYLVEGWHDGKLIAHIPRLTLEDAKASAAVFSQHYTTTKLVPLYAAPPAAPAPAAPAAPVVREPLTDEQIWSMWMSSEFRGNGGQADWFCEGIRAAEAHHGITGGKP